MKQEGKIIVALTNNYIQILYNCINVCFYASVHMYTTVVNSYPIHFPAVPGIHFCLSLSAVVALVESRKGNLSAFELYRVHLHNVFKLEIVYKI